MSTPPDVLRPTVPVVLGDGRRGPVDPSAQEHGPAAAVLQTLTVLTVALQPIEGYLLYVDSAASKAPAALLVGAWATIRVLQRRAPQRHPVHLPLAALMVLVLASTAISNGDTFAVVTGLRWVLFIATAFVLLDVTSREVPPRLVLWATVCGAVVAGAGALVSFLLLHSARATGPLENPNDLAYVLVAAVPLLIALFPPRRVPRPRLVTASIGAAAVVLVLGTVATVSRGGLVALACVVSWLVVRRGLSGRVLWGLGATVAVLGLVAATLFSAHVESAVAQKGYVATSNVEARELRWEAAVEMMAAHPLSGVGPGGFRTTYRDVSGNAEPATPNPVVHNMYLEVAAELGVPGLVAFGAVIATAFAAVGRARRRSTDRSLPLAVEAALIGIVVASIFLSEEFYMPLWSMVALACALDLRSRQGGAR